MRREGLRFLMLATPDALCSNGDTWGLEAKSAGQRTSHRWGEAGTDEVPQEYLFQCAWCMATVERPFWDLAVLLGGNDYREYRIARDTEFERQLIELATRFWTDHVEAGVPPPPDASESAKALLARLYPTSSDVLLSSTVDVDAWADRLRTSKKALSVAAEEVLEAENYLKAFIGDAAGVEGPWGVITWKKTKDQRRTAWKAVATDLGATPELIALHTVEKQGSRRFLPRFTD